MTQKELIQWALSAVKHKRVVMVEAHQKYYETKPEVAETLFKVVLDLNDKQYELEKMLEEAQK